MPGKGNHLADELSRPIRVKPPTKPELTMLIPEKCFVNKIRTVEEREEAMYLTHDIPSAGHPGIKRMMEHLARSKKNWETMKEDIELYVGECLQCQKGKPRTGKSPGELHPMPVPPGPWSHVGWDLVGPITESSGKNTILCITDLFSKAIKLEAVMMKITAEGAVRIFRDRVFWEEGLLTKIYSNQGPQFARHFMKELMGLLHIKANVSTLYHPQTDGQTE